MGQQGKQSKSILVEENRHWVASARMISAKITKVICFIGKSMSVAAERVDLSQGWTLQQALERTADPELWNARASAKVGFDKGLALISSGASAFNTRSSEIVPQRARVICDNVEQELRQKLATGILIATGSRGGLNVTPTPISREDWRSLEFVDFEKSIVCEPDAAKTKIFHVRVNPLVHSADISTSLAGCSLAEAFRSCVLDDPEVVAKGKRVIRREGHQAVFHDGQFPGLYVDYKWPIDLTVGDCAFGFVRPFVIWLDRPLPKAPPVIKDAAAVLVDRWNALVRLLVRGTLAARGTFASTGIVGVIDPLQWRRHGLWVDVKNGDLLGGREQ